MTMPDGSVAGPAPRDGRVSFVVLLAGASVAPLLWLAQMLLSYAVSADVCTGLPWAAAITTRWGLQSTLFAFDVIAMSGAMGGGILSYRNWRRAGGADPGAPRKGANPGREGMRFLAQWGMLSSVWFLSAIVFNTIASIMIAPCPR